MDLRDFLDKLRGNGDREADETAENARQFEKTVGTKVPDEEPIRELGAPTQQERYDNAVMAKAEIPFGLGGAGASKAAGKVSELAEMGPPGSRTIVAGQRALSPEEVARVAEDMRKQGFAHVFDDSGKLIKTVGQDSPEGKKILQWGQDAINSKTANAPSLVYGMKPTRYPGTK